MFYSGPRLAARRDAKAEALRELRRRRTELADLREDLLNEETFLERIYRWGRRRPVAPVDVGEEEDQLESRWRQPEVDPSGSPVLEILD